MKVLISFVKYFLCLGFPLPYFQCICLQSSFPKSSLYSILLAITGFPSWSRLSPIFTHTLAGFAIEKPAMEWTLYAIIVDYLSANTEVRPHVCAIWMERIHLSLRTAKEGYILAGDVDLLGLARQQLFGLAGNVPSVGIGGQRSAYGLFGSIVISFHPDSEVPEDGIVDCIEEHHTSSENQVGLLIEVFQHEQKNKTIT